MIVPPGHSSRRSEGRDKVCALQDAEDVGDDGVATLDKCPGRGYLPILAPYLSVGSLTGPGREVSIEMKYIKHLLTAAVLLTIGLALPGCSGPVNHSVADGIKAALPQVVGPADEWDVDVTGNPGTIIRGRIPGVHIHGVNVHVSPQVTMAQLDVNATNVCVDIRRRTLKKIDSLTFSGIMTQSELDDYLASTAATTQGRPDDFKVRLNQHDLTMSFSKKVTSFRIPVNIAGRLAVSRHGDNKIDFLPSNLKVARLPIPERIVKYVADAINPAIDLSDMSFPVHLANIHVDSQRIMLSGEARIPKSAFQAAQQQATNVR